MDMDINTMRSIVTVLLFIVFIGIVWWSYSDRRKASFARAAMIPLEDGVEADVEARIEKDKTAVQSGK
jgi:cytochrome c oxidase cbb3-type subunit 4